MRMTITCLAAAAALSGGDAQAEFWTYKDWTVVTQSKQGGRVTACDARGGPEGWPQLMVETSDVDTKPPALFPSVSYSEPGFRGVTFSVKDGDRLDFVFDDGAAFEAHVGVGVDAEGIPYARAVLEHEDRRPMLGKMRTGSFVDVMRGGERLSRYSLSGFTAAYGKIAEQCRFSTVGVID